ncbi:hypothetical protein TWF106_004058 [Orbilia oligospora]|uniref:Uncharacterized protein n=1 Tax=Orbilia oligospora TaxID=2813651 RepID=A0A6G1MMH3_ORBOL|nr:hypothetical protein TWF788_005594 [Orbilia oligospora]KAF3198976.1 hypothetical protein TWF106_004058 [Orbilia oligospora]KAF3219330.1 hypothetical protein TWF191_007877 [Orbilia oligospora]KAF3261786.1 hypothetical protein TWF192_008244 [Orbilia oligospora]
MRLQVRYPVYLIAAIQLTSCVVDAKYFPRRALQGPGVQQLRPVVLANSAPALEKPLQTVETRKPPVEVEMFVMSKCPDARDCVRDLVLPVMAQLYDSGIITLRPTYIGTPDDSNAGMACKHGPDECLGDMLELCAYELHKDRPQMWLGFINCMGQNYQNIPQDAYVSNCASEYGLSFDQLERCAASEDENRGMELLRASARRAIDQGISTSCTVTVNGKTVCVRDNGQWKGCTGSKDDLVQEVQHAYDNE